MKIACIGDLHGSDRWKEVNDLDVDHCVFVGDYVDSGKVSNHVILTNLEEVVSFKKRHLASVTLLLGNHDVQYMYHPDFTCSGFVSEMCVAYQHVFRHNSSCFQVAAAFENYLFTHGGLGRHWALQNLPPEKDSAGVIAEELNFMMDSQESLNRLNIIGTSRGGKAQQGGPVWCDYHRDLVPDPFSGVSQVVGHTPSTFLLRHQLDGQVLYNVNYLAYSDTPIFVLEI